MIEHIFQNITTDVGLMPIRGVQFYSQVSFGDPYDANIILHNLESESSLRIIPITRNTHLGTIRRLGYKLEVTLYIPYNKLNTNDGYELINSLEEILKSRYTVSLIFGTAKGFTSGGYTPPAAINSTYGLKITTATYAMQHSVEIETIEYRPRIILRLFGFVKNLLDLQYT